MTATEADLVRWGEMPWVTLTEAEMARCRECAQRIEDASSDRSLFSDRHGLYTTRAQSLEMSVVGVMGELALSRWLDVGYRCRTGAFQLPDVGPAHVRTTKHRAGGLIVRPGDAEGPYVLVIDHRPTFHIAGWMTSQEAMTTPLRTPDKKRPGTHFVEQGALHPLPRGAAGLLVLRRVA